MKSETHAEFLHDLHFSEIAIQYKNQKWFLDCGLGYQEGDSEERPEPHIETHVFGLTDNVADIYHVYTGRTNEECFRNFVDGFRDLDGKTIFEAEPDLEIAEPDNELDDLSYLDD